MSERIPSAAELLGDPPPKPTTPAELEAWAEKRRREAHTDPPHAERRPLKGTGVRSDQRASGQPPHYPSGVPATGLEWRVRYQREDWKWAQSRFFQSERVALRYVDKLRRGARSGSWSPLVWITLESRPVGAWNPERRWTR